jgi:hypothetical protein
LRNAEPPDEETARGIIDKLFFSDQRYNLGEVGRYRINKTWFRYPNGKASAYQRRYHNYCKIFDRIINAVDILITYQTVVLEQLENNCLNNSVLV